MECREWQRKIQPFLDDSMNMDELERFVKHIRVCRECYDELEIMFVLSHALLELESTDRNAYNFRDLLDRKLSDVEYHCERIRSFNRMRRIILMMMNLVVLIGMFLQIIMWII